MIEIKAEIDINDAEVQEKAAAGKIYCDAVTVLICRMAANSGGMFLFRIPRLC